MDLPISREEALDLLKSLPQEDSDMNHYLESEAIMRALAEKFGEDVEYWGMVGLLHDVDWSLTKRDCAQHGIKCVEILKEKGFSDQFIRAVQSHAYGNDEIPALKDKERTERIEHCLVASETVTGIIYAYALMRGRKISDMKVSSLKKKFKEKSFARNCNRDLIMEIEEAGMTLDEFLEISLEAVKKIKDDIGLE